MITGVGGNRICEKLFTCISQIFGDSQGRRKKIFVGENESRCEFIRKKTLCNNINMTFCSKKRNFEGLYAIL